MVAVDIHLSKQPPTGSPPHSPVPPLPPTTHWAHKKNKCPGADATLKKSFTSPSSSPQIIRYRPEGRAVGAQVAQRTIVRPLESSAPHSQPPTLTHPTLPSLSSCNSDSILIRTPTVPSDKGLAHYPHLPTVQLSNTISHQKKVSKAQHRRLRLGRRR